MGLTKCSKLFSCVKLTGIICWFLLNFKDEFYWISIHKQKQLLSLSSIQREATLPIFCWILYERIRRVNCWAYSPTKGCFMWIGKRMFLKTDCRNWTSGLISMLLISIRIKRVFIGLLRRPKVWSVFRKMAKAIKNLPSKKGCHQTPSSGLNLLMTAFSGLVRSREFLGLTWNRVSLCALTIVMDFLQMSSSIGFRPRHTTAA